MPENQRAAGTPAKENSSRRGSLADGLWQDVAYALRQLRRSPGFAAVAILTLALGIGANTGIFSLVNTVMLTKIPVGHPDELVLFHWTARGPGPFVWDNESSYGGCDLENGTGDSACAFSYPVFQDFEQHAKSFESIAAQGGTQDEPVLLNGQHMRVNAKVVSGNFFSLLEVRPAYGRTLLPGDDAPGAAPAAVLDYVFWQKNFRSDPRVVGTSLTLKTATFNIVGVAPPEFFGIAPGRRPDMWISIHSREVVEKIDASDYEARSVWLYLIGRLKPGVTREQARLESEVLYRANLASTLAGIKPTPPDPHRPEGKINADLGVALTSAAHGLANLRNSYSTQLYLLLGVTGLVLLIACANVANLLLARGSRRRKEIAVRLAIGAGRARLVRQLLTESAVLALLGAGAGLMVSYWMIRGIAVITFRSEAARLLPTLRMSPLVFGFAAGVAALCAVLFGLMPALRTIRFSPGEMLKSASSTSGASANEGRNRLGRSLVAAEVAVALVLVVGAGLALRTLVNLETVDTGFRRDHLLTVTSFPTAGQMSPEKSIPLARTVIERLGALPGVERATWAGDSMGIGDSWRQGLKIVEHPELDSPGGHAMAIGPQYFETLGIPVLAGRSVSLADMNGNSHFLWVNEAFAAKFLKGVNPVGLHATIDKITYEIAGTVGNTKFQTVSDKFEPGFFLTRDNGGYFSFQLRTAGDPAVIEQPVRQIFARYAPDFLITEIRPLQAAIDDNLSAENALARLFSGFGVLALGLAALGVYGVLAYSVSRRTSEIAIRMSLGAVPADILRLVVREGLIPAAVGSAIGIGGAWAATRLITEFLYGVKPLDLATFAAATAILLAVAIVACLVPARRAMKVAPMVALRYE